MPITPTYPGVYIEELPSNSHTITPAPTAIGAFIGYTHPFKTRNFDNAVRLLSFADYETQFGGFIDSPAFDLQLEEAGSVAHSVYQFFLNGGSDCYVVGLRARVWNADEQPFTIVAPTATMDLVGGGTLTITGLVPTDTAPLVVQLSKIESGPDSHVVAVDTERANDVADIVVTHGTSPPETFRNVNVSAVNGDESAADADDALFRSNYITARINDISALISVEVTRDGATPEGTQFFAAGAPPVTIAPITLTASPIVGGDLGLIGAPNGAVTFNALVPTHSESITVTVTDIANGDASKSQAVVTINYDDVQEVYPLFELGAIEATINGNSKLVTVGVPVGTGFDAALLTITTVGVFDPTDFTPVFQAESELDKVPIFNIMVLPGVVNDGVLGAALAFCEKRMAFMILDPGVDETPVVVGEEFGAEVPKSTNGALYYPYIKSTNPATGDDYEAPPSGTVAGIFARTDVKRGVWKSPAGLETTILNTVGVVERGIMTDPRQGVLNELGVNCLRSFPNIGTVVYGARTLVSANSAQEQWKYVAVRRMALFIEQTMLRNLTWAVFEPNDTPLWDALRISVENFMSGLYAQNAFQGGSPSEAFEVICDSSTTTQTDVDRGIVNIIIKFAPLKPAEFVIVKIGQLAGQTQS